MKGKTVLLALLMIVGIYTVSYAISAGVSRVAADTTKRQDLYDTAQNSREYSKQLIVDGCMEESSPDFASYCGCFAENVMNADRATFNELMRKFNSGTGSVEDAMPYAEPCLYLVEA